MKKYIDFLFPVLFVVLSCLGAMIGRSVWMLMSNLKGSGEFVNWELLEGNHKFVVIEEANSHSIWAKTSNGNLYFWEFNCNESLKCREWSETQQIPNDIHETGNAGGELPMEKGKTCPNIFSSFPKEMPQKVVECAAGPYQTVVRFGRFYALLEDGTIWHWKTPVPNDGPNPAPLIYSLCGVIAGSVIALVMLINHYKKKKQM
jgi:hypothetical protein